MSYRTPIFIQAGLGKSADPSAELFRRWESYGQQLEAISAGQIEKIVVYFPDSMLSDAIAPPGHLEVHSFRDSLAGRIFLIASVTRYLKKNDSRPVTLIAGDLFISPLIAIFSKWFSKAPIWIQIQFHGAAYNEKIRNLRSLFRVALMRIALLAADSIRVVSPFQVEEIRKMGKSNSQEFVIAPIPVNLDKVSRTRTDHDGLNILVMGRLHQERGIDLFKEFLSTLSERKFACCINVVGDGPLREDLMAFSQTLQNTVKVKFHGKLEGLAVKDQLSVSDLLVSFAPQEGYGLAIREAMLSGVFVIARRNSGTSDAKSTFSGSIELFDSTPEAIKLVEHFVPSPIPEATLSTLREGQEKRDREQIGSLIRSWIKI